MRGSVLLFAWWIVRHMLGEQQGNRFCFQRYFWRRKRLTLLLSKNSSCSMKSTLGCSSGGECGLAWNALGRQWPDFLTNPHITVMLCNLKVWFLVCTKYKGACSHWHWSICSTRCKLRTQEQSVEAKRVHSGKRALLKKGEILNCQSLQWVYTHPNYTSSHYFATNDVQWQTFLRWSIYDFSDSAVLEKSSFLWWDLRGNEVVK